VVPLSSEKLHTSSTDPRGERASRIRAQLTRLQIDLVTGAANQHVRRAGVNRECRLVLLGLCERRRWAADADERIGVYRCDRNPCQDTPNHSETGRLIAQALHAAVDIARGSSLRLQASQRLGDWP